MTSKLSNFAGHLKIIPLGNRTPLKYVMLYIINCKICAGNHLNHMLSDAHHSSIQRGFYLNYSIFMGESQTVTNFMVKTLLYLLVEDLMFTNLWYWQTFGMIYSVLLS